LPIPAQPGLKVMDRVARDVEREPKLKSRSFLAPEAVLSQQSLPDAIGHAACLVAENIAAAAILAFTQTGSTAALIAKYQPTLPIIAITPDQRVKCQLALYRGIESMLVDIQGNTEAQILSVEAAVLERGLLKSGDIVVITMGSPLSAPGTTNLLKVHRLERRD
jgi:pyruvate kinase